MAADMGQEEHDRDAVARGRALTALVRPYLPVDVLVDGPADAWPLVGPALIARATGSLEAILALVPLGREADADTLLRSLYEHVTTFAWLAGEPGEERMRRWLKSDCEARLRADEDCRKVGVKILDDDRRKEFEETAAARPKACPPCSTAPRPLTPTGSAGSPASGIQRLQPRSAVFTQPPTDASARLLTRRTSGSTL
jgi:hypothetical protein